MSNYKVVIDKNSNYYDAVFYSFDKNICILNNMANIKEIEEKAKELSNNRAVFLFNLTNVNDLLLNMLPKNIKKYLIFEYSISEFSEYVKLNQFLLFTKYLEMKLIDGIYCLNYTTYKLLKDKYKAKYLELDIPHYKKTTGDSIGVITASVRHYSSTMNAISAITLTDYKKIKVYDVSKSVIKFAKDFNLKVNKVKTLDDVISNNIINLYINFSMTCYDIILKSMDMGIPCIVGNTDFFNSNETLKRYLVISSDDDINEIKNRILLVIEHRKEIMKEYKEFRKKYKNNSLKGLESLKNSLDA